MQDPIEEWLAEVLDVCREDAGEVADYIPEWARADPDRLAGAFCTVGGDPCTAGDAGVEFSIQSISRPFVYPLALHDQGLEAARAAG